jgi:hypothetical protein
MKILICQICDQEISQDKIFEHLIHAHEWKLKAPNNLVNNQPTKLKNTKKSNQQTSVVKKHQEYSYNWAHQQRLDSKFKPLINELASTKSGDYLNKEIEIVLKILISEPNNIHAIKRLILVSKAKHKLMSNHKGKHSSKKVKKEMNKINFNIGFKKIKGISQCSYCNKKRLECFSCIKNNGQKMIICKDCKHYHVTRRPAKVDDMQKIKTDAMDFRVSGSYGTGRK